MQRYLSIVLDELCIVSKTLVNDDSFKLDSFISTNFNSSEEIRDLFKSEISNFFKTNEKMIKSIEEKNHKKYRGQIVILEALDDGSIKRVRVLYKGDLVKLKKEYLKNQQLMREYITTHRKYFSDYINNKIKRNLSKTDYEYMINEWYRQIKNQDNYFEICRSVLKYFDNELKKEKQCIKSIKKDDNFKTTNNDTLFDNDYDLDREYHPDLDELEKNKYKEIEDEYCFNFEDDLEKTKTKTKKKNLTLSGQLSFFE